MDANASKLIIMDANASKLIIMDANASKLTEEIVALS